MILVLKIVENAGTFDNYPSRFSKHCIWEVSLRGCISIGLRLWGVCK